MGDPAGLRDQVDALFLQWAQLSEEQPAEKQHNGFVAQLQQAGFLKVQPPLQHTHDWVLGFRAQSRVLALNAVPPPHTYLTRIWGLGLN